MSEEMNHLTDQNELLKRMSEEGIGTFSELNEKGRLSEDRIRMMLRTWRNMTTVLRAEYADRS